MPKKIMLVAGEASGDNAAAEIVKNIKIKNPEALFFGIGGKHTAKAGMDNIINCRDINLIGFIEVISGFQKVYQAMRACRKLIINQKPDYIILVDYPGFNLKLAKFASQQNIPVLYYISPKIWAWKKKRIYKIKDYVSHMAVIFPFEVPIYKQAKIKVDLVKHPSINQVKVVTSKQQICDRYNIDCKETIICMMPGSRKSEIKNHMPILVKTISQYCKQNKGHHFIIPVADTINKQDIQKYLTTTIKESVSVITDNRYDLIAASDYVIAASGTATLEIALLAKPLCVIYKTNNITYQIAKRVIKIPYISLCNIIVGENLVTELIQYEVTAINIIKWLQDMQKNPLKRNNLIKKLVELRVKLDNNLDTAAEFYQKKIFN